MDFSLDHLKAIKQQEDYAQAPPSPLITHSKNNHQNCLKLSFITAQNEAKCYTAETLNEDNAMAS